MTFFAFILPFIEQTALWGQMPASSGADTTFGSLTASPPNGNVPFLTGAKIPIYHCPSSPYVGKYLVDIFGYGTSTADYVGISGSDRPGMCSGGRGGPVGYHGMLVAGGSYGLKDVADGTSHTLVVSEQSDFGTDVNGNKSDIRTNGYRGAFWGTKEPQFPPIGGDYSQSTGGAGNADKQAGVTTVHYQLNFKDTTGSTSTTCGAMYYGCSSILPLQSAHPGGVLAAFVDGHATFLNNAIDITTLQNLADRDDGNVVPDF